MDDSNKKEFATIFYAMGEFYDKQVSKELLLMYFDDLSDFNINDIRMGAKRHRQDPKHGTFFPKPADIIRSFTKGDLTTDEKAQLAWSQVSGEISRIGSYGTLNLSDKQAMAAVRALGTWKDLCATDVTKMDFKKREFLAIYKTYENTPINMLPDKLPGLIELQQHKEQSAQSLQQLMSGIDKKRLN